MGAGESKLQTPPANNTSAKGLPTDFASAAVAGWEARRGQDKVFQGSLLPQPELSHEVEDVEVPVFLDHQKA